MSKRKNLKLPGVAWQEGRFKPPTGEYKAISTAKTNAKIDKDSPNTNNEQLKQSVIDEGMLYDTGADDTGNDRVYNAIIRACNERVRDPLKYADCPL